ncbi:hypothetical protein MTO96_047520 [Rhipicephalus appendiculatus]
MTMRQTVACLGGLGNAFGKQERVSSPPQPCPLPPVDDRERAHIGMHARPAVSIAARSDAVSPDKRGTMLSLARQVGDRVACTTGCESDSSGVTLRHEINSGVCPASASSRKR